MDDFGVNNVFSVWVKKENDKKNFIKNKGNIIFYNDKEKRKGYGDKANGIKIRGTF